jgi:hypothetical protein
MDVLSVAASVTALVQVAEKVVKFVLAIKDAPSIMHDIVDEVVAIQVIFHSLQQFILDLPNGSEEGKEMITIDQLVITLTGCVSRFTELEGILGSLETDSNSLNMVSRAKWAQKGQDLGRIIRALQNHKLSLNLIMSIYSWLVTIETNLHSLSPFR